MQRDTLNYDVLIVGAGPAGLAAAIRLKQLSPGTQVCVVEKAAQVGGHSVAGAVLEPSALNQLLPDWRTDAGFTFTPVSHDAFWLLTAAHHIHLPTPPQMRNQGNGIINPPQFVSYLGRKAQDLGIEIFTGFAAQTPWVDEGVVRGVVMGDFGLDAQGAPTAQFAPGPQISATVTLLAEGCRGHLTKELAQQFNLQGHSPQTYALGLKEVWRVQPGEHRLGEVVHTIGAPLPDDVYGGGWVYHLPDGLVSLGLVVGLDYTNPQFSPHDAFQAYKQHPLLSKLLSRGEKLSASARALYEGGLQGMYHPVLPGALLLGDAAGTLNVPKIKGLHTAMASGMLAAEAVHQHLNQKQPLENYLTLLQRSALYQELKQVRNIRPGFKWGLWAGLVNAGLETLTRGLLPWTLSHHADHRQLQPLSALDAAPSAPTAQPQHPTFTDRATTVFLGGQAHREGQPVHLRILEPDLCASRCVAEFGAPCTKFCPAGVYEILDLAQGTPRLQINSSNCIHCKTCDIKDPYQIINWVAPEGGSGPNLNQ